MGIRLRRPTEADLDTVLSDALASSPTYPPASAVVGGDEAGFRRDRWWGVLGEGDDIFVNAGGVLRSWGMHRGAGFVVRADGPLTVGETVAMSAPLPIGYIDVTARVTDVIDDAQRCGFTYVTLPNHPEIGEESFTVVRDEDQVGIEIIAVWRLRHPLGRLVPPVARLLQRRATERYILALQRAVAGPPGP